LLVSPSPTIETGTRDHPSPSPDSDKQQTTNKIPNRRTNQCNATISLKQFFDMVYEEPKKMLLYGDACRVSTDPIAKASYFFDLIQVSVAPPLQLQVCQLAAHFGGRDDGHRSLPS
jgi:hypothetical protein